MSEKNEMIDLRKIAGIQFDPEARELTSGVVDELDYVRGLIGHLWDHLDQAKQEGTATFGTDLLVGWIDSRLEALRNHTDNILKGGEKPC